MTGYVTLGTNRFDEAAEFYDELLARVVAIFMPVTSVTWTATSSIAFVCPRANRNE